MCHILRHWHKRYNRRDLTDRVNITGGHSYRFTAAAWIVRRLFRSTLGYVSVNQFYVKKLKITIITISVAIRSEMDTTVVKFREKNS
jgi:hypothetical protein